MEQERTLYLSAGAATLLITSERCGTFIHWRDSLSLLVSPQQIIRVIDRSHSVSGSAVAAAGAITLAAGRGGGGGGGGGGEGEEPGISQ